MTGSDTGLWHETAGVTPARPSWRESWRDAWQGFVERKVTSPGFRRWAAGFWLTRPLVRRRAAQLFDLVSGFVYTQVLLACVRLDLFERLAAQGPQTAAALAQRCELPLRSMQRLLDAAVALRLLAPRAGGCYGLGTLGAPMVGNEGLAAMVALALTACGGGGSGDGGTVPTDATPVHSGATASLAAPGNGKTAWNVVTPIAVTLRDSSGATIAGR